MSSSRRSYLSVASNNSRSRSRSSTRRGRTSNRDALRKAVLLRNAKKLPHRSEAAFELTAVPQHIRIRRVIQTDMETIRVYTSITVCPRSLIEDQAKFEEAHKSLHQVKQEKMREKKEENKNPVESVCQKVWYSKSMVRVTRDVTISRELLLNNWETSSNEAMVSGFKTLLPDSQQTFSDIYTSSTSKNGEKGYHNKTYMTFAFNQAEGKRQDGHLVELKNSNPNLEGWCGLDSCVKNYGPVFKLRLSHYMLPNAYLKETSVEETRNYEYNPNSQLTETKSEARTPKLKTPKQEPVTPHKTPSTTGLYQTPPENRSQYLTPEMTTNRSTHAPVKHELPIHPNAIPVPQSLSSSKGVPHLNLDTPQLGKKPSQVFFSDTRRSVSPYTAISPGVKKDSLNEGTSQTAEKKKTTADGEQKHTLILDAEIGGEAHEFEGNITLKTQEKFIPKRVVVDKRTLWERPPPKNDWKSTTTEN